MGFDSKQGPAVGLAAAGAVGLLGVAWQQVSKGKKLQEHITRLSCESRDAKEALRTHLQQAASQAEQLQQKLDAQTSTCTLAEQALHNVKVELASVKEERRTARLRVQSLESEAVTKQQEHEKEVKQVQWDMQEVKRQAQHHAGRADNLYKELETKTAEWEKEREGLLIEVTRLEQRAVQAEALAAAMRCQRQQLEKTQQVELQTASDAICDLALELMLEQTAHASAKASLADAMERGETADRLLAETKEEVQHLKEQVDLLSVQAEEEGRQRAAQAVQLEDVRRQLKEQKAVTTLGVQTVQQLEADKLAMRTEINNNMQKHAQEMSLLKGKLEDSEAAKVKALSEAEVAKKVARKLTTHLQGELDAAKSSLADKEEEVRKLDMEHKEAEAEAAAVHAGRVDEVQADLVAAQASVADKDQELKQLRKQAKRMRQERDHLSVEKAEATKEIVRLKDNLNAALEGSVASGEHDAAEDRACDKDMKEVEDVEQALSPRSTTSSPRIPAGHVEESDLSFEAGSGCAGSQDGSSGVGCSTGSLDDDGFQVVSRLRERGPRAQRGRQQRGRRPSGRREAGRVLEVPRPAPARPAVTAPAGTILAGNTTTGGRVLLVPRRK